MRLFFAIFPPIELARDLDRCLRTRQGTLPRARWTPPENVHLTLRFLGDRSAERAQELAAAARAALASLAPLEVELTVGGCFTPRRPRVLWIATEAASDSGGALHRLHRTLESSLEEAGEPSEGKALRPHLTLGRCKSRWRSADVEAFARALSPLSGRSWWVEGVALVVSELLPRGARYRVIETLPLGPTGAGAGSRRAENERPRHLPRDRDV